MINNSIWEDQNEMKILIDVCFKHGDNKWRKFS